MSVGNLAKAWIIPLEGKAEPIECLFNPKEYSVAKQSTWSQGKAKAGDLPHMQFGGGQPAKLTLQLFFDTYESGDDVRKEHTEAIWNLVHIDPTLKDAKSHKARPPKVRFQWGSAWSFNAVITSVTQKFTLFDVKGVPLRATLDVQFQEIENKKDLPKQNPTSAGRGGARVWKVQSGDTLAWIAYREYGDANLWPRIANANQLTRVRDLSPGTLLEIPDA